MPQPSNHQREPSPISRPWTGPDRWVAPPDPQDSSDRKRRGPPLPPQSLALRRPELPDLLDPPPARPAAPKDNDAIRMRAWSEHEPESSNGFISRDSTGKEREVEKPDLLDSSAREQHTRRGKLLARINVQNQLNQAAALEDVDVIDGSLDIEKQNDIGSTGGLSIRGRGAAIADEVKEEEAKSLQAHAAISTARSVLSKRLAEAKAASADANDAIGPPLPVPVVISLKGAGKRKVSLGDVQERIRKKLEIERREAELRERVAGKVEVVETKEVEANEIGELKKKLLLAKLRLEKRSS